MNETSSVSQLNVCVKRFHRRLGLLEAFRHAGCVTGIASTVLMTTARRRWGVRMPGGTWVMRPFHHRLLICRRNRSRVSGSAATWSLWKDWSAATGTSFSPTWQALKTQLSEKRRRTFAQQTWLVAVPLLPWHAEDLLPFYLNHHTFISTLEMKLLKNDAIFRELSFC